ncbi:ATP-citrate synthase alpha chain protein 2 [Camellia lanceoleosa]|uniref:ATP-citrate synthase alpha chain protein 2 n=1 Tax=Camellia lanceoleosa TaxID=1840588 RepID=A0ACC0HN24_9ERIC|nr:ATP-citrate synthase alpha chain protein 2 [Camellia lanceoleosa]
MITIENIFISSPPLPLSSHSVPLPLSLLSQRRSATLLLATLPPRRQIFFSLLEPFASPLSPPPTRRLSSPPFAETPPPRLPLHQIPKIQQSLDPDFLKTSLFCWVHRLIRLAEKAERTDSQIRKQEYYLSIVSERLGCTISFSEYGGIEIEENWDKVKAIFLPTEKPMTTEAIAPLIATLPLEDG